MQVQKEFFDSKKKIQQIQKQTKKRKEARFVFVSVITDF